MDTKSERRKTLKMPKSLWITAVLCTLCSVVGTAILYDRLPEQIPVHWNATGQVDGLQQRGIIWAFALGPLFMMILLAVVVKVDPKSENYRLHPKAYTGISALMILVLFIIHWMILGSSIGLAMHMSVLVPLLVGVVFSITGNVLPQVRQTYTFGIKTPWALDNKAVWKKTQRVGGYAMVVAGILILISAILPGPWKTACILIAVIGVVAFTTIYFYLLYRAETTPKDVQ